MVPIEEAELWRICGDYRVLKNFTKHDMSEISLRYLPDQPFLQIDLKSAYYQIPVAGEDKR